MKCEGRELRLLLEWRNGFSNCPPQRWHREIFVFRPSKIWCNFWLSGNLTQSQKLHQQHLPHLTSGKVQRCPSSEALRRRIVARVPGREQGCSTHWTSTTIHQAHRENAQLAHWRWVGWVRVEMIQRGTLTSIRICQMSQRLYRTSPRILFL